MRPSEILTLPNVITLARLPLAVLFLFAQTTPQRLAILGMASASDFVDGWLARRSRRTTRSGALLDPIADKTFVLAALTAFVRTDALSTGEYFVILSRDFATAIGFLVASRLSEHHPELHGRIPGRSDGLAAWGPSLHYVITA